MTSSEVQERLKDTRPLEIAFSDFLWAYRKLILDGKVESRDKAFVQINVLCKEIDIVAMKLPGYVAEEK